MPDRELEFSPLTGLVTRDGVTVQVHIYRFAGTDEGWTLEVVDHEDGSTVWEGSFDTDVEACASSDDLRRFAVLRNGGSGPSG